MTDFPGPEPAVVALDRTGRRTAEGGAFLHLVNVVGAIDMLDG